MNHGYTTTVQSPPAHTDVHIETQTLHKYRAMMDLEDSSFLVPGKTMVGADLSGIELRLLAHYLARYDQGRYARLLLEDDIHQVNADKIGISRRQVKTVTYAIPVRSW